MSNPRTLEKRYQHIVTEAWRSRWLAKYATILFRAVVSSFIEYCKRSFWIAVWSIARGTVSYSCKLALRNSLNRNESDIVSTTTMQKCTLLRLHTMYVCLSDNLFTFLSTDSQNRHALCRIVDSARFVSMFIFIFFMYVQMFRGDQSFREN